MNSAKNKNKKYCQLKLTTIARSNLGSFDVPQELVPEAYVEVGALDQAREVRHAELEIVCEPGGRRKGQQERERDDGEERNWERDKKARAG